MDYKKISVVGFGGNINIIFNILFDKLFVDTKI